MSKLLIGTNVIFEDEPCLYVKEEDRQAKDSSGFRRYRTYGIVRNDKQVEFVEDLGSTDNFIGVEPLNLWTGIIDGGVFYGDNVGYAREFADQYRNHHRPDVKEIVKNNDIILR